MLTSKYITFFFYFPGTPAEPINCTLHEPDTHQVRSFCVINTLWKDLTQAIQPPPTTQRRKWGVAAWFLVTVSNQLPIALFSFYIALPPKLRFDQPIWLFQKFLLVFRYAMPWDMSYFDFWIYVQTRKTFDKLRYKTDVNITLAINVPVGYMVQYVVVFRGTNPQQGPFFDFFGPKWHSLRS
jgi:hypothetical protein